MFGPAYYQAGSSFPAKNHAEDALRFRLQPAFRDWTGQQDVLDRAGALRFSTDIDERLALLRSVVSPSQRPILIGRSSGGRVASLVARAHGAAAVVCLGYPFREPNHVLDPNQFSHLADVSVPTLIIQGMNDPYGGINVSEDYALSASVTVRFIRDCDHEFLLRDDAWDSIAEVILSFCGRASHGMAQESNTFDEAFYLMNNRDVADAVASGSFASGEQHYVKHGRDEGRSFRSLVDLSTGHVNLG